MRILPLSLPLLLVACGDKGDDTGADVSAYETDDDGDGVSEADGDCDDADAGVFPGAEELCDGIDNDCDGTLDDGAGDPTTFYWDHDGDGVGNGDDPIAACALPDGASADAGDCDDLDAAIHPSAAEVCDGVDNDCDGAIDDDDDSIDASTHLDWYRDADEDGYGDAAELVGRACEALPGTVSDDSDCDDAEPAVNPGQAEVCDIVGIDEDCDGLVNDEDDSIYVASQTLWRPDADGDGFGDRDDAGVALCADPSTEALSWVDDATDCADDDETTYPGATEVCSDGAVNDCDSDATTAAEVCAWNTDLDTSHAGLVLSPEEDDFFSWFAAAGDLNGDGTEDLVVGAPWSYAGDGTGRAYVLHGPLTGTAMDAGDDVVIEGLWEEDSTDTFGVDPVVTDVDGDGYDDLWAGAPGVDVDGDNNVGAAFLLLGPLTSGTTADLHSGMVVGVDGNSAFGTALAVVGDHDGDSVADLLVSDSYGGSNRHGVVYLMSGDDMTGGALLTHEDAAIATFTGEDSYDFAGGTGSLASLADVNGDGQADVVIGAGSVDVNDDSYGKVYVFFGPVSGDWSMADADAVLVDSTAETEGLGYNVLGGFDWDGDGADDLAIGAPNSSHSTDLGGAVYVQAGPITADVDLASGALWTLTGAEDARVGGEMDFGDLDGDGEIDLLLGGGARSQTGNGASHSSVDSAFVALGPLSGAHTTDDLAAVTGPGEADEVTFGGAVVVLGDQDGDGADVAGIYDGGVERDTWFLFPTPGY